MGLTSELRRVSEKIGGTLNKVNPFTPIVKARKETAAALEYQRQTQELQRRQKLREGAEQAKQQRLLMFERARQRRLSMAEDIVGAQFGMLDSTQVDGPNMEVNTIPTLDDMDDMGNNIPEV